MTGGDLCFSPRDKARLGEIGIGKLVGFRSQMVKRKDAV
jgi:hypothetical protein